MKSSRKRVYRKIYPAILIDFVAKYSRAIPESNVTLGHATAARRSAKIDCAYYAYVRNDARESVIDSRKTELNRARRRERTIGVRVAKKLFSLPTKTMEMIVTKISVHRNGTRHDTREKGEFNRYGTRHRAPIWTREK